ncbi:hypothetical protein LCGC14_1764180 [marine sediment metagenome]|uniref:Chemotaxis phosphatase CheX-like domain-containing protein n=1 Tax=marine sediment metagenome TaxID=412755 RepID=A0A0F9H039_9ZZZZ
MCNETVLDIILYRVAEDVLASLAFMLPMPPEEMSERSDENCSRTWAASVGFTGHANGSVTLAVREEMLPQLAANMLGLPEGGPEASPQQQQDALAELANVICGNLLTEIWGAEPGCTPSPPRLLGQEQCGEVACDHPPAASARLHLCEGSMELALFVAEWPGAREVAPSSAALAGRAGRE